MCRVWGEGCEESVRGLGAKRPIGDSVGVDVCRYAVQYRGTSSIRNHPTLGPTVGLCLGPCGGPRSGGPFV